METRGIPLDIIVDKIYNEGYIVDWYDFICTGLGIGWKLETILTRIRSAFEDCDISYPITDFNKIIALVCRYGGQNDVQTK